MAGISEDTKVKVHPLTANSDLCYRTEESAGRYANVHKVENTDDLLKDNKNCIRFVCISDTHDKTDRLDDSIPDGDVLIHAGDITRASASNELIRFNEFVGRIKHKFKHIVVIAGNHDLSFDQKTWNKGGVTVSMFKAFFGSNPFSQMVNPDQAKELMTNCTYIEDETIELYGIKIHGSPWQPPHFDLAFNETRGERILEKWDKIPAETDILVTHGPPLGIGDKIARGYNVGCAELLATITERVKPKYHVFGHIHEAYGVWNDGQTTFINASICDKKYRPVHRPIVFDYELPDSTTDVVPS